jgi:hypothetical protein
MVKPPKAAVVSHKPHHLSAAAFYLLCFLNRILIYRPSVAMPSVMNRRTYTIDVPETDLLAAVSARAHYRVPPSGTPSLVTRKFAFINVSIRHVA